MIQAPRGGTQPQGPIGLVDVGTCKVVCLVAEPADAVAGARPRVIGIGHRKARGIKASVIADLDLAEASVKAAIGQAERMAGVRVEAIYLSVSGGRVRSLNFDAATEITERVVGEDDIGRVMAAGRAYAERDGRALLHLAALGFRVDSGAPVDAPRGMIGRQLTGGLHAVVADDGPLRSLLDVAERCRLRVAGLVPAPYASAMAVTSEAERRSGVVVVDLGGGTTQIAMFVDGRFVFASALAVGSHHATYDIARRLSTPIAEAERIKTLYGTLVRAPSDVGDRIAYQYTGNGEPIAAEISRAELSGMITPRFSGLFAMLAERIDRSGVPPGRIAGVVLTGGASQLTGIADFASSVLGRPVRIGRLVSIGSEGSPALGPVFATAAGLSVALQDPAAGVRCGEAFELPGGGYLGRVGQWLKQSF